MRLALALASLVALGCYKRPEIPRDKPLACASQAADQCPVGFVCVGSRVCAPRQCGSELDCPRGTACVARACVFPPTPADAGADGAAGDGASEAGAADAGSDLSTSADAGGGA